VKRQGQLRGAGTADGARAQRPAFAASREGAMRRRRRRLATIGAAGVLATMVIALSHQYAKTYALAREQARLEHRRRDLIADNARLREEIERLQTDDRYIEEIARGQLGLVRPDEIELFVVPYDGTVSAPPRPAPSPMAAPAHEGEAGAGRADDRAEASPPPHRGIGAWAVAVRDAVRRLLRLPAQR
jgi:cell division protein FtsL